MIRSIVNTVPEILASALAGTITLLLLASVIGRYSGLYSLVWVEEVSRGMFTWLIFLGAAVAVRRQAHFSLSLVRDSLSGRGHHVMVALYHLSLALLGLCLLVYGVELIIESQGLTTNVLAIPVGVMYAGIPVGGALFILYSLQHLWDGLRGGAPKSVSR